MRATKRKVGAGWARVILSGCARCRAFIVPTNAMAQCATQAQLERDMRECLGWRKVRGRWLCRACLVRR